MENNLTCCEKSVPIFRLDYSPYHEWSSWTSEGGSCYINMYCPVCEKQLGVLNLNEGDFLYLFSKDVTFSSPSLIEFFKEHGTFFK